VSLFCRAVSLAQGACSGPPPPAQALSVTSLAGTRTEGQFPSWIEQGLAAWRRLREPENRPLAAGKALGSSGKLVGKASLGTPPLCPAPSPYLRAADSSSTGWGACFHSFLFTFKTWEATGGGTAGERLQQSCT